MDRSLILIAHNVRSTHNVGSLLRTAEGLGVEAVYLTGYTPYPAEENDARLPHISRKMQGAIHKTALGAETAITWHHQPDVLDVIANLQADDWTVVALEQADLAIAITESKLPDKIALVVGREVEGIEPEILDACDTIVQIPMFGQKESFNVVQAAAMALFWCRFMG